MQWTSDRESDRAGNFLLTEDLRCDLSRVPYAISFFNRYPQGATPKQGNSQGRKYHSEHKSTADEVRRSKGNSRV